MTKLNDSYLFSPGSSFSIFNFGQLKITIYAFILKYTNFNNTKFSYHEVHTKNILNAILLHKLEINSQKIYIYKFTFCDTMDQIMNQKFIL